MTGVEGGWEIPPALVRKRRGPSAIWIVPIVAALVGGWLWIDALANRGPTISVHFTDAEGLKPGKTVVKFKNLPVGVVDSISIEEDLSGVIVRASLEKSMEYHLGEGTLFWVVRPRIEAEGISGLTTLLSGAYIAVKPVHSTIDPLADEPQPLLEFDGLDEPPVERGDLPGLELLLHSDELASIYKGAPVFFHGLEAGQVRGFVLSVDGSAVDIDVWIKQPFVRHVRDNSRFWLKPLIDLSASADGIDFSVGSLRTLISGGISFGFAPGDEPGAQAGSGHEFVLYRSFDASTDVFTDADVYVLFFDEPVRGLRVGAPVEFRGIKVGRVLDFRLEYDSERDEFFVPVHVEIDARRIRRLGGEDTSSQQIMAELLSRGLRARMETGTFLTGAKYVSLTLLPDKPAVLKGYHAAMMELPTVRSAFASAVDAVKRLSDLTDPAEQLIESLRASSDRLRERLDSAGLDGIEADTERLLGRLNELAGKLEAAVDPTVQHVDDLARRGEATLDAVEALLSEVSQLTASDSRLSWLVTDALAELAASARSLRVFTDYLERHPEALLKGKAGVGDN